MKDVLLGHMNVLAEQNNVSGLTLKRDYAPDDPRVLLSQSYNSYISETAGRAGNHFAATKHRNFLRSNGLCLLQNNTRRMSPPAGVPCLQAVTF